MFLFSRFLVHFGGSITYIFLPTLMLQKHLSLSQGAYVLSAAACTNTVSRFSICALTDHHRAPSGLVTTIVSLIVSGMVMISMPFWHEYYMFLITGMLYGIFCAPVAALLPVVVGDLVTLDELNYVFGLVAFAQGIGSFGGPPTAGLLIDQFRLTGNGYGLKLCYVCGGTCMITAGVCSLFTVYLSNKKTKKQNGQDDN